MLTRFLLLIGLLFSTSCATRLPKAQVNFHSETPPGEIKSLVFGLKHNNKGYVFRKFPDVSTSAIEAYKPFPGRDKLTYGAVFFLDRTSGDRLGHFTSTNKGGHMISRINGKLGTPMQIDKAITDNVLVVWEGLALEDLQILDMTIRRQGASDEEFKKRAKAAKEVVKAKIKNAKKKARQTVVEE